MADLSQWLIPPAIMAFDAAPDRKSTPMHRVGFIPGYSCNEGIDHLAQAQLASYYAVRDTARAAQYRTNSRHLFGGFRNYGTLPPAVDIAGQPGATAQLLPGGGQRLRYLCTHWVIGYSDADRASAATLAAILAGQYDARMRDFVASLPIGGARPLYGRTWSFRIALMGELDVITAKAYQHAGGTGREPLALRAQACAAVIHQTKIMTEAALALGATPDEFGAGGLVTGWTMNRDENPTHSNYDWWRGLVSAIPDPAQRRLVVGFVNPYFYHVSPTVPEDPRPAFRMHRSIFADAGISRYVVGETTCGLGTKANRAVAIGTEATQAVWVDWAIEALDDGTVEWLGYFHSPGGYASDQGALRGLPLQRLGLAAERVN